MAYVSVSRGAHDAQIFTGDCEKLPEALSRDVTHQSAHVSEIANAPEREIKRGQAVAPAENIYTMVEHERHWGPLNEVVTPQEAQQFAWKQETGTIQSYQHIETGRYVHIYGADGESVTGTAIRSVPRKGSITPCLRGRSTRIPRTCRN